MTIDDYLLGHWSNRQQAQSNPHSFAQTEIIWEKEEDWYYSKNFYRVDGPTQPYRQKRHKIRVLEDKVIMENYRLDLTRNEECDMLFLFEGDSWHGKLDSERCSGDRGNRIVSEIHLYGDKLHCKDQGFDSNNNVVWGSPYLYRFIRVS